MTVRVSRPGRYFRSFLEVFLEPDRRPDIVAATIDGDTPAELARELGRVASARQALLQPVVHVRLTAHSNDCIPDVGWGWIAETFAGRLGYGACPWVAILHREAGRDHLHLVACRIRFDGSLVPGPFPRLRARAVAADLERELDLHRELAAPRARASVRHWRPR